MAEAALSDRQNNGATDILPAAVTEPVFASDGSFLARMLAMQKVGQIPPSSVPLVVEKVVEDVPQA